MSRPLAAAALLVALTSIAGCGDDEPEQVDDTSSAAPMTPTTPTTTADEAPSDLGDAMVVPVTGRRLCRLVPPAAATAALGTEVVSATPSDESTPQCAYSYGGDSSTLSSFTIASQRPEDVGGRGLQEAFDHVLELNRGLATGTVVDETDIAVGDRAVSLTGDALTLTVLAVGEHLLTVITTPDVDAAAVEALAGVVATALS